MDSSSASGTKKTAAASPSHRREQNAPEHSRLRTRLPSTTISHIEDVDALSKALSSLPPLYEPSMGIMEEHFSMTSFQSPPGGWPVDSPSSEPSVKLDQATSAISSRANGDYTTDFRIHPLTQQVSRQKSRNPSLTPSTSIPDKKGKLKAGASTKLTTGVKLEKKGPEDHLAPGLTPTQRFDLWLDNHVNDPPGGTKKREVDLGETASTLASTKAIRGGDHWDELARMGWAGEFGQCLYSEPTYHHHLPHRFQKDLPPFFDPRCVSSDTTEREKESLPSPILRSIDRAKKSQSGASLTVPKVSEYTNTSQRVTITTDLPSHNRTQRSDALEGRKSTKAIRPPTPTPPKLKTEIVAPKPVRPVPITSMSNVAEKVEIKPCKPKLMSQVAKKEPLETVVVKACAKGAAAAPAASGNRYIVDDWEDLGADADDEDGWEVVRC